MSIISTLGSNNSYLNMYEDIPLTYAPVELGIHGTRTTSM